MVAFRISLIWKINARNLGTKEHHANEKEIKLDLAGFCMVQTINVGRI